MEKQAANNLAHELLESEFNELRHNPADYCRAMGWPSDSDGTKTAIKHKENINFNSVDVHNLTGIISSNPTEDTIEATESNSVSDFLTNCVAGHINVLKPLYDIEGNEIEVGDEVAYATVNKYKPVIKRAIVVGFSHWDIKMKKYSCPKRDSGTRLLIIKKGK